MAGKRAAWSRAGNIALTSIAIQCYNATNYSNTDAVTNRECYVDSGSDLVIWTYHFTSFAAYTPAAVTTTPSGSGSSSTASAADLSAGVTKNFTTNLP